MWGGVGSCVIERERKRVYVCVKIIQTEGEKSYKIKQD